MRNQLEHPQFPLSLQAPLNLQASLNM